MSKLKYVNRSDVVDERASQMQAQFVDSIGPDGLIVVGETHKISSKLEGRLRTLIDAIGLEPKQTKAIGDMVAHTIWSTAFEFELVCGTPEFVCNAFTEAGKKYEERQKQFDKELKDFPNNVESGWKSN